MSYPGFLALRSLLFVPAADDRKLVRAFEAAADGVIRDLEDGVAPEAKEAARATVVRAVRGRGSFAAPFVRVNAPDTEWGLEDLAALRDLPLAGVVVPKATPASVAPFGPEGPPLIAIVETALGLRSAFETASHPRVAALLLGGADLGAELGLQPRLDGLELLHARSVVVVDSAAAGIRPPFDVVNLAIRDSEALRAEAELAKSLGFGGKACIHPAQVETVNRAFAATEDELTEAREIVQAYEAARADARGVTVVRGRMVDLPVVSRARATLARGGSEWHESRGEGQ